MNNSKLYKQVSKITQEFRNQENIERLDSFGTNGIPNNLDGTTYVAMFLLLLKTRETQNIQSETLIQYEESQELMGFESLFETGAKNIYDIIIEHFSKLI